MSEAIVIDHVTKRFGDVTAVDDLSLTVPQGCVYGFLGPNGAGKTTTIRMIMSIFLPDQGNITVLGQPNTAKIKDQLGYLPEERGLYKKMKAGEIITYFGRLKGLDPKKAKSRAEELLHEYGLGEWIDKKCESLSKGMGQKVQILGTLVHEPELVILDEPFSGLDPVNLEVMRESILQMKRKGKTVIFSTHIMEQAEQICDYIFLINKGVKVLDGTLSSVKAGTKHGILIDYDGDLSFLQGRAGIERINDSGKQAEIFLTDGTSPQQILGDLVGKVIIRRFDLREPSLHEIFIRSVGGKIDE